MFVVGGLMLIGSAEAMAQGKLRGSLRLGADFGGDKVGEFQYSDGSTPDIIAGTGILFGVGASAQLLRFGGHGVDLQANAGVKYRTIPPASNQEAEWIRYPVEGLLMYHAPGGLRIGGGVTTHLANKLAASGAALNDEVTFKAEPGAVAQVEWMFTRWSLDLRYTALKYPIEGSASDDVDASSIGLGLSYWFGGNRAPKR